MEKTALITGASSGIGKALAKLHAGQGGDLVLVARSQQKLNVLAEELSAKHDIKAEVIVADLSKSTAA